MCKKMSEDKFSNGKFVISLDFELFWGVRDKRTIESYGKNIKGVREVIPALLSLCNEFDVRITFSTVGFLFAKNRTELQNYLPAEKPAYADARLSPYPDIPHTGTDEYEDPYHFGYSLVKLIEAEPQHEIGTHTFSHYYCLEPGQTITSFTEDLRAAKRIAEKENLNVRSLVFPRNQFNETYLEACKAEGIESYRGNPVSWLYEARSKNDETPFRRFLRLADAYVNISGHHCHDRGYVAQTIIPNVAASRFLRPYNARLASLDGLRLRRITNSMRHAAKENKMFHLWWHPHNFGVNLDQNMAFLKKIFLSYRELNKKYGFESDTMSGIADKIKKANG
jgi:peptidoglycan/xylan/chitin deacetylase (PgdA/CDA1 family)